MPGLLLAIIRWVEPKQWRLGDSGRLCIDPSTKLNEEDTGATNEQIPAPGTQGAEERNPTVHYGTAFARFLKFVYNLRIDNPDEDIILAADDISGAFRRLTYHPDMAVIFSTVFQQYLLIPVGMIFGSRDSPSLYMVPGELRSFLAASIDFHNFQPDLATNIELPPRLSKRDRRLLLQPATPDSINTGYNTLYAGSRISPQVPFVDDTGNCQLVDHIKDVIRDSVLAAYLIFGFPKEDPIRPPINATKWVKKISHRLKFLGFVINTRSLTVEWPPQKRDSLYNMIQDIFDFKEQPPTVPVPTHPSKLANILGLIRNGASIAPLGVALSLHIQYCLTDAIRSSTKHATNPKWWRYHTMVVKPRECKPLHHLWSLLLVEKWNYLWKRPIGMLIPRDPTIRSLSDAAPVGLGGWSKILKFMWRLTAADLARFGIICPAESENPKDNLPGALHINILEFLAIIINAWFTIKLAKQRNDPFHHIILLLADNTSALSWLQRAARVSNKTVRALAIWFHAFLTYSRFQFGLQSDHIPGPKNVTADRLSRPLCLNETWASVINACSPRLDNCQAYQVPHELLSKLSSIITSQNPGDLSE